MSNTIWPPRMRHNDRMADTTCETLLPDAKDRQIIALLLEDARLSYSQIGRRVGLSAPAVKHRVDRLRDDGVILGFTAVLAPEVAGGATEAFVELYCRSHTNPDAIRHALVEHPQVVAAYTVTGDADALLRLRALDVRELERVLERIRTDRNTERTRSSIVLSRLFERPAAIGDGG